MVELLVVVALFALIVITSTQIFQMVLEGQRNAVAAQNVQENIRYALEVMSKELRMAKQSDVECMAAGTNKVYNISDDNAILYFKNKDDQCVSYYLESGRLKINRNSIINFITPSDIVVSNMKFDVVDNLIAGEFTIQPTVTIELDVYNEGKDMHKQNLKIQTTISSRYYEENF